MNERGKSDSLIVPGKLPNKGRGALRPAEEVEGRGLAKGNPIQQNRSRTQRRQDLQQALERIRQAAHKDRKLRFTALWHHVYSEDRLRESYYGLKRNAAPGVDGQTWQHYGEDLEDNLRDLSERLRRGAYRARPVKRTYIPKRDGRERPIGVTALEDKIVQRAVVTVLEAIYETDFKGFSYGFRPRRSAHDALDAPHPLTLVSHMVSVDVDLHSSDEPCDLFFSDFGPPPDPDIWGIVGRTGRHQVRTTDHHTACLGSA